MPEPLCTPQLERGNWGEGVWGGRTGGKMKLSSGPWAGGGTPEDQFGGFLRLTEKEKINGCKNNFKHLVKK